MLIYKDEFEYIDPFNVIFLCGNEYKGKDKRDKRIILKQFLQDNCSSRVIILEENFAFRNSDKNYLSYDNAFLRGLSEIEQLASLYANKIIIIHETISTAAELGMFAINPDLAEKVCLLVPDSISIEEDKISAFIEKAFLNNRVKSCKVENIIYYPDVRVNVLSENVSYYHTYFHENRIGDNLSEKIKKFLNLNKNISEKISIQKSQYKKPLSKGVLAYWINNNKLGEFYINVDIDSIKIQLLSILLNDEFKDEFKKYKKIYQHVTFIVNIYKRILLNTILNYEGLEDNYKIKNVKIRSTICDLRQVVGYFLYMLQAIKFIELQYEDENEPNLRKIVIKQKMKHYKDEFNLISEVQVTEFETKCGKLMKW